ncbi:uncharacterized protein SAPINGB_P001288 [Magnusiomyces paraingens]|uniref:Uncharacterized protein n=1 Tax=Magnusiomyces paraingens TaxID=2606893 RepID=A0A5E8B700_9ASCO|nr:uncharacterized protein SAPINGB_P001288 [Saprochaete ingens]VVT46588.1 unnamed protein product [Saprochaete ingens]
MVELGYYRHPSDDRNRGSINFQKDIILPINNNLLTSLSINESGTGVISGFHNFFEKLTNLTKLTYTTIFPYEYFDDLREFIKFGITKRAFKAAYLDISSFYEALPFDLDTILDLVGQSTADHQKMFFIFELALVAIFNKPLEFNTALQDSEHMKIIMVDGTFFVVARLISFYEGLFQLVNTHPSLKSFVFGTVRGFYLSPGLQKILNRKRKLLSDSSILGSLEKAAIVQRFPSFLKNPDFNRKGWDVSDGLIRTLFFGLIPQNQNLTYLKCLSPNDGTTEDETSFINFFKSMNMEEVSDSLVALYDFDNYHKFGGPANKDMLTPDMENQVRKMDLSCLHSVFN